MEEYRRKSNGSVDKGCARDECRVRWSEKERRKGNGWWDDEIKEVLRVPYKIGQSLSRRNTEKSFILKKRK